MHRGCGESAQFWELEEWPKAIADCEKVLRLNPYHFGAYSGMASAADYIAVIDFDDVIALQAYLRHPAHAKVVRSSFRP